MAQKKKPSEEFKKKAPKTGKKKPATPKKEKEKPYTGGGHWRGNPSKPAYVPPHIRREQW